MESIDEHKSSEPEFDYFPTVEGAAVPVYVSVQAPDKSARLTLGMHGGSGTIDGDSFEFSFGLGGTLEVRFKDSSGKKGPCVNVDVRDLARVAHDAWRAGRMPSNIF